MEALLASLANSGPAGMVVAAIIALGWMIHGIRQADKTALLESKVRIQEDAIRNHQEDKRQMMEMIGKNSEAFTKNASSSDNCTRAIKDMSETLHHVIVLLHQMLASVSK